MSSSKFLSKIYSSLKKKCDILGNDGFSKDQYYIWGGKVDAVGYGRKKLTWPDGYVQQSTTHRLLFLMHYGLTCDKVPVYDECGRQFITIVSVLIRII